MKAGYPVVTAEKLPDLPIDRLTPQMLRQMIDKDPVVMLVDIRDDDLYEQMPFVPAETIHLRMVDLTGKAERLPKGRRLVIVDHLGKQVGSAAIYLKSRGFTVAGLLDGGVMAWQKAGLPMKK